MSNLEPSNNLRESIEKITDDFTFHGEKYRGEVDDKLLQLFQEYVEGRIGFMRQWLNEDRIPQGKSVTSEELLYWLDEDYRNQLIAEIKGEE